MSHQNDSNSTRPEQGETAVSPLLEEIIESTQITPEDEAYDLTMQGLHALVSQLAADGATGERVSRAVVDKMIAELDKKISVQLDEILHHPEFQKKESIWRSLKFLVDRTDFRENNKLEILNASKEELLDDFEDTPEITKSGLYKLVYAKEYGQFGGEPYATMVGNYEFGAGNQDIKLLGYLASVAAMAHAPFIAGTAPSMFRVDSFEHLPQIKDLSSIFQGPQYAKWKSLREKEDARYVGLTLPRFLLRLPYGPDNQPVKSFDYNEDVSGGHGNYLWGNVAFALSSKLSGSFAKYRWCTNIIGPKGGGAVEDLPLHSFEDMGAVQHKIPTEVLLSERREYELAEQGFIGLTMRKGSDNAAFFSANSIQMPKSFPNTKEGREAEFNYRLGTQLPYMFIINRLAHYLKVIQRENIGLWKERIDLEKELNQWIRQYVVNMDNPLPGVRSRRPLREAKITVEDIPGEPGFYGVRMSVRPHFKYMGASFTLSIVGKLDKD
ncbi:MAG: type VI secretion system contractile sheath large subunit [Desulfobacterales bacterium]